MRKRFTVLTPTYNRANLLPRLYESLRSQTFKDFEWIVVDDGSIDNTPIIVRQFQDECKTFAIKYLRQENGGKHRALNKGVSIAEGELVFIADSDDWLPIDALSICDEIENSIPQEIKHEFAGIGGLDGYESGDIVGSTYASDEDLDILYIQRQLFGITGDKKEVFYTEVMRKFPYPEYPNEKFMTECVTWNRMSAAGLKIRYFKKIIYLVEYQQDGISAQQGQYFINSPKGWALYINEEMKFKNSDFWARWNYRYGYYGSFRNTKKSYEIAALLGVNPFQFKIMMLFLRIRKRIFKV